MGADYWNHIEELMDEAKCNYRRMAYSLLGMAREMDRSLARRLGAEAVDEHGEALRRLADS